MEVHISDQGREFVNLCQDWFSMMNAWLCGRKKTQSGFVVFVANSRQVNIHIVSKSQAVRFFN